MKRKFYIIFSILTVAIIATYFGFQYFNQATQEPEMVLDFGKEGTEMRRMETKNLSPYAIFGDSSVVLMTEAEEKGIIYLDIPNRGKNFSYSKMNLDLRTGIVKIYDKKGLLIETSILRPEILARFLSVDRYASKYPDLNPYNFVANNPLRYTDPTGDTIEVAGNQTSRDDINSLVRSKNQQYLSYNGNNLTLNFGNMAQKDIDKLLKKDKGLALLNNMVNASENFYYAATTKFDYIQTDASGNPTGRVTFDYANYFKSGDQLPAIIKVDGREVQIDATAFFRNVSRTPRGDETQMGMGEHPLNGYDGMVYIAPGSMQVQMNDPMTGLPLTKEVPRASVIYHELNESYRRTHLKQNYSDAHNGSIRDEGGFYGHPKPGSITTFTFGHK